MSISGFLYSQVGYDIGDPMRAIVRSTEPEYVPGGAAFAVYRADETGKTSGDPVLDGDVAYWGELWDSHWWVVDFSGIDDAGRYVITISTKADSGSELMRSETIELGHHLLWQETVTPIALEQLEARRLRARNQIGWMDCGSAWRECNSHASAIIGLAHLLCVGFQWLTTSQVERLREQLIHGCQYLCILQDTAADAGAPEGAFVHEIPNHLLVIPGDAAQSCVALASVGRLLADTNPEKSVEYIDRATRAMEYLITSARPYGAQGFSTSNHGAPEGSVPPPEFMTRDLAMMMWGCVELYAAGRTGYQHHAARFAREVIARQVPSEKAEIALVNGQSISLSGHFYTFSSRSYTEKANCHHDVGHDTGTTFPHFIAPLREMGRRWPDHPDAPLWAQCCRAFAEGYLVPACRANPFYLLPEGFFTDEGLLWFCGPWHGINTSYGYAAMLAGSLEGAASAPEPAAELRQIVVGNLQWFCGLNAGITSESFGGCLVWRESIPEGTAVAFSQIFGVGRRWTGNWTGIRGTVPNGFDVNPQFQLVVPPTKENDKPLLYTDEDWIPHGAGFLAGLATLRSNRRFG